LEWREDYTIIHYYPKIDRGPYSLVFDDIKHACDPHVFASLMAGFGSFLLLYIFLWCSPFSAAHDPAEVRDNLHFSVEARQFNKDGSIPTYKNPKASIEARVNDLLPRMTLEEKISQL